MESLYIPVLLGTGRETRQSEKAASFMLEQVKAAGMHTELVDVRDVATQLTHHSKQPCERTDGWRKIMTAADGLVIVTPEYNRGYPGELKITLDSLLEEYDRKAVALCGVSSGIFGGARAIENLKPVLTYLGMFCVRSTMNFGNVKTIFDEKGAIADPAYAERAAGMLKELQWWAQTLKAGRLAK